MIVGWYELTPIGLSVKVVVILSVASAQACKRLCNPEYTQRDPFARNFMLQRRNRVTACVVVGCRHDAHEMSQMVAQDVLSRFVGPRRIAALQSLRRADSIVALPSEGRSND
jgi:hypothetical protein